jgi:hypothetical protein
MTIDLMLVSRETPTMADLREACAYAERTAGLGAHELVGDLSAGDPMVEVSADVTHGELLLQVFRPSVSQGAGADEYSVALGVQPPLDDGGRCWLTAMAMSGTATEVQTRAVLAIVRHLAQACTGYLVVDGHLAELEGVDPPAAVEAAAAAAVTDVPPPARAFLEAFLSRPTGDQAGWRWLLERLKTLVEGHPELRPRWIRGEREWRPFLPTDPEPDWWPTPQKLLTTEPYVTWEIDGAGFAGDRYSQVSMAGDLSPRDSEALLPGLLALPDLDYGLLHYWTEREPSGPSGFRSDGPKPMLQLTARSLTESLPNLYWAQVLGGPWVDLFGPDRIAATPAHRVAQVAPGRWLVQLTEHLSDVVEDHARFDAVRETCKQHLGADAFYSPERGPSGSYRSPVIPTLGERGLA